MSGLEQAKTILCPYDFTPACQASLRESLVLAKKLGAAVEIVHVVITPPLVMLSPSESVAAPPIDQTEFIKTVTAKRGPEITAQIQRCGIEGVVTRITFKDGMHADLTILEHAESIRADVIVMAKHARAAISRFLIGSTTERVLRHAKCAVLVVPGVEARKPS